MPGFKTFTNTVLTAADVNGFLMTQAFIQCTSSTRPASPHEGMLVYETDTQIARIYADGQWRHFNTVRAWEARTPVLGNVTTPKLNTQRYHVVGKNITVDGWVTIDTLSGISGTITIDLPFNARSGSGIQGWVGSAWYLDTGVRHYPGSCYVTPGTNTLNLVHAGSGNSGLVNATNPFTFGDSDVIAYAVSYEVA